MQEMSTFSSVSQRRPEALPRSVELERKLYDASVILGAARDKAEAIGAMVYDPATYTYTATVDDVDDEVDPIVHPSPKLVAVMAVNSAVKALELAKSELKQHLEVQQQCAAASERIQAEVAKAFEIETLLALQRRALEIAADSDAARERQHAFTAARNALVQASAAGTQPINAASEMVRLGHELVWVAGEIRALDVMLGQQHRAIEAQLQLVPLDEAIAAGFRVGLDRSD